MRCQGRPLFLLTDFGTEDPWVGVLKGVISTLAPHVFVYDLSHAIPPGDIEAGLWFLTSSWDHLPPNAVVLACVDPGVGSQRPIRAVRCVNRWLVGPDNGLLGLPGRTLQTYHVPVPTNGALNVASTFQARDVMAPVAARLASEGRPRLDPCGDELCCLEWIRMLPAGTVSTIPVVWVDRFGNVILPVRGADLTERSVLRVLPDGPDMRRRTHYAEGSEGELFWLSGSHGFLELAMNQGSAAEFLGIIRGDGIVLQVG